MKWQAVIVLLAIALSIFVPPSLSLTSGQNGHAMIGTLDLCHKGNPALSVSGNMPCVSESSCHFLPLSLQEISEIVNPRIRPFFIVFQDDHPPKS
jgi:hypothetical protein